MKLYKRNKRQLDAIKDQTGNQTSKYMERQYAAIESGLEAQQTEAEKAAAAMARSMSLVRALRKQ